MKVFITGATGFVGMEVLRQLQEAGHTARILSRHPGSAKVRECASRFNAEVQAGDVTKLESLTDALQSCDAIIHLVGIISEAGANTYENVHTRGTQNIVAAAQNSGVRRFIHMSALGTRPNAVSRYHRSKWAAEEMVRGSGLDWTIFRPSIIYGPNDSFVNLFARMSRFSPVLPIMGDGKSKLQPVPVSDVAACFTGALTKPISIGQTYDLCGKDVLSFEEILDTILAVTGRKRFKIHIPLLLARMQASLLEFFFGKLLGKPPPLNRDQLIMLGEGNVGDPKPANDLFHLQPVAFKEGIAAYLRPRA